MVSNNSIHVLQIISSFDPLIGGAERATAVLSEGLHQSGHCSTILTRWYPGLTRFDEQGDVTIIRLGISGPFKVGTLSYVIHAILWILYKGKFYSILHTQNLDAPLLIATFVKLLTSKRWVATIHGEWELPNRKRTLFGRVRLCALFKLVDSLVAISEANQEAMIAAGFSQNRIVSIPNGINTEYMRPPSEVERSVRRKEMGYTSSEVVILYLGRLIYRKRCDLLLHAFSKLDNTSTRCIVVGDGEQRDFLERLIEQQALGNLVTMVGAVENVRDYFWLSDIFVLPSQYEGLPVALLEAMACGRPVITSNCNGNLQIVTHAETGLSFSVDNEAELLSQLTNLVEDQKLRSRLGHNARKTIQEKYGMAFVCEQHLALYKGLLQNYGRN